MAGNSVLAKMAVQISANNAQFASALNKSQRDLSTFTGNVMKVAGALGVAFGIQQIASFALEVAKLSGEAQAVRAAFERLPESTKLMRDLKEATGGTVSELDLMKRAVQASNFGISLGALPKLLEFATLRAQQTGQSVDYLVDSIVTGIGRKSKLILDNLGISAVQLNEALGDTAIGAASIGDVADAVGRIIDNNLEKMNGFMDNNSTKLQRLTASWTNLKVAIGDASNETGLLGKSLDVATASMDLFASNQLSFWEKLIAFGGGPGAAASAILEDIKRKQDAINKESEEQAQVIREVDRAFKEFNGDIDAYGKAISTHVLKVKLLEEFTKRLTQATDDEVTTVGELREVEKELLAERESLNSTDLKALEINSKQIQGIRDKIKAIDDLLIKEKEVAAFTLSQTAQRAMAGGGPSSTTTAGGFGFVTGVDGKAAVAQMQELRNASAEVTQEVKGQWLDLSGTVGGALTSMAEGFGGAIVGMEDFGSVVLKAFAGFAKEFGSMLIASGVAALALNKLIVNPVAAIAAGVGLVAIAGAASASLSRAHSQLTGGNSSYAPGRTPSEVNVSGRSFVRGYTIQTVLDKNDYRRGRLG